MVYILLSRLVTTLALPSFPTRRSSDLILARGAAWWPLAMARGLDDAILMLRTNNLASGTIVLRMQVGAQHDGAARDRKSTRLNSSHLGISYAVFCLKKKKRLKQTNGLL